MKLSLEISAPSALWRGLPRARAIARETVAACVAESRIRCADRMSACA